MKVLGYDINIKKSLVSAKASFPKSSGRTNPSIVKIVDAFKDRSRKDIDKWRTAIQMYNLIENPKANFLHDLIDDLLTDGHLQSQIQMRKMSTLNTDFHVINKNGDENEELTFILRQQWFYKFLDACLETILRGVSVSEFYEFNDEKIKFGLIPRRNVAPTKGVIYPDVNNNDFIQYRDNPALANWIIEIGDPNDLGLINNIIPNLIWKRNVMQSWAEFCERFGMPLITATTNTSDTKIMDNVHNMLLQLGEASVGVFPAGTEIKFQEANRTDVYQVYKEFMQANSDEISKQLVGSTMLADQGSNRSQTEVHERTLDNKIAQADKRNIQFIINDILFPFLQLNGYKIADDDVFEFKTTEQEIDLPQLWTITSGLITNGYEVQQDWISKTFNIPLEGKKKSPTPNKPNIAASYFPSAELEDERYPFSCSCGNHIVAVDKPSKDQIDKFSDQLVKYVFEGKDTIGIEAGLISEESNILLKALRSDFKTFNQYEGSDHAALQMMEYNLFEFSASKTESRLASMTELLVNPETKKLRDFPSFRVECDKQNVKYNHTWLESEYNLSIAVGQTSAQYLQFMAEKDSVTSFVQYQTVGDDKVRASHQVLDGKIFNLSDKEAMDLWPPNGYGCRCEMLQYLGDHKDKVLSGTDAKSKMYLADPKYKGSQFEINRGDLKQVFTKKQFYSDTKGLPEKINKMTFDKYIGFDGHPLLKAWKDFKDSLKILKLDKTITSDNVQELFKKVKDKNYMGFEDYLGRKLTMAEKVFKNHTKGKYINENELRHQLFPHVEDILKNPDEVWMYDVNDDVKDRKGETPPKYQTRYVKFYKDQIIIIETELNADHGLTINTWYPAKKDETVFRKGLKIK